MRKLKLLFAACALLLGVSNASADVMLETDLTSQFNSLATTKWTLSSGQVGWAAPKVTTNSGLTIAAWERYDGNCNWTGDIMYSSVTGLAPGTYKIELYGAAAFTFNRGFGSTAFTGDLSKAVSDTYTENQSIAENTGVTLYAQTSEGTVSKEIPIWYATNFNTSGIATATLDNVVVGESGTIKIGLSKTSTSTNWHVVQLKGVTATVSGDAVIETLKATAYALLNNATYANVTGSERSNLQAAYDATPAAQTQEAYQTVISNLNTAISAFEACDYAAYDKFVEEKAKATALGIDVSGYTATNAADAATKTQTIMVEEYNHVVTTYEYDYSSLLSQDLTQWATSDYAVMSGNEHWNGLQGQRYYEQTGAEWGKDSWSHEAFETPTLPAGSYVMTVTARASANVTSSMSVKIGDNDPITVSLANKGAEGRGITTSGVCSFSEEDTYANGNKGYGWEYRYIAFTVAEESPVTIKFNSSTNTINNWVSIAAPLLKGNVHPNQIKLNQIKELVATLAGYKDDIPAGAYDTFATDITNANNATVDSDDLDDIIAALQGDIETAKADADAYADFIAMKAKATTLKEVANDNSSANEDLGNAISAATTNVAAAANVEAINTVTSTLKGAMATYVGAANPVGDGAKFDCTFMLTNPDLTPFYTGGHNVHPAGWATEQADGNYQVIPSEGAANPDGIHKYCYEYWSENPKENSKFNLYTPVTLPEGTYTMSCYAFADQPINGDNCAVYFYANDTQGGLVSDAKLTQKSISFVNKIEQEVKIGLKPLTGNTYRWMGIGYVELYKVPAKTYTVSEDADYDNSQEGAGDVTLNRTIKVGINTVVLPFSMTQSEVENYFGLGSKVYALSSFADDNISFITKEEGISANLPVLLDAKSAGNSYEIKDRTIVAGTPTTSVSGLEFIGTYAASLTVPKDENSYIINNGYIYLVDSEVTLKGTRAYFHTENAGARVLTLSFDGETTGIVSLKNGKLNIEKGDIYDLSGRRVETLKKGIYVLNGKKIVK